ncbi:MAG: flagellar biosynthetic protein FliQ [bacterium]|nr:flagellar biosynthetic protein FliQ [bacterium]
MSDAEVLDILAGAFTIATKIAGPILMTALIIGVVISLVQTVTQIQEMTLTFVPKLVGSGLVLLLGGNWMLREMISWIEGLWSIIPTL